MNGTSIPLNTSSQNPNLATINLGNTLHEGPADAVSQIWRAVGGRVASLPDLASQGFYEVCKTVCHIDYLIPVSYLSFLVCNATFTVSTVEA